VSQERLPLMLQEAGFVPLNAAAPEEAAGFWMLAVADFRIDAVHDARRARLLLSAPVGEPPPWQRNEIFELAQHYNDHCDETAVRLALDEATESLVVLMDLPLGWLENGGLARAFFGLVELRGTWRQMVAKDDRAGGSDTHPALTARGGRSGHIHV